MKKALLIVLCSVVALLLAWSIMPEKENPAEKNEDVLHLYYPVADAELTRIIDRFLRSLPEKECYLFLRRYWYMDSIADIADRFAISQSNVKSMLFRTRNALREFLEKEGYTL